MQALAWIDSGDPLYRMWPRDVPDMHLVSYFVVYDASARSVLLVDHIKANLWLPTGGHVEPDELPHEAVIREAQEELDLAADFTTACQDGPLFITITETRGAGRHTDVSLWFVLTGNSSQPLDFDTGEFRSVRWVTFEELELMNPEVLDPHMLRFAHKFQQALRITA